MFLCGFDVFEVTQGFENLYVTATTPKLIYFWCLSEGIFLKRLFILKLNKETALQFPLESKSRVEYDPDKNSAPEPPVSLSQHT